MTDKRKDCPMRHENGNCTVAGGFCTAVNDPICEALHNAFDCGHRSVLRQQEQLNKVSQGSSQDKPLTLDEVTWKNCATCSPDSQEDCRKCWSEWTRANNCPLTLEELLQMDGEPVWVEFQDGSGGKWGIVHITMFNQIVFANGLHCTIGEPYYGKTWLAYRQKPEEVK